MSIQESKAEKMLGIFFAVLGILLIVAIIPWQIASVGALMWFFGQRDLRKLIPIAVILPVIVYFGFTELLKLRLP